MRNEINLQDRMLSALRQQAQNITVFLTNGFQMRGIVRGFDSFVVILESDGKQQMIYKHGGQPPYTTPVTPSLLLQLFYRFSFSLLCGSHLTTIVHLTFPAPQQKGQAISFN